MGGWRNAEDLRLLEQRNHVCLFDQVLLDLLVCCDPLIRSNRRSDLLQERLEFRVTDRPIGTAVEQGVLAALAAAREGRDQADSDLVTAVAAARRADMSWAAIGAVLGMSKQGAHSFFADRI